jgi:excisionase family DNA binding protein
MHPVDRDHQAVHHALQLSSVLERLNKDYESWIHSLCCRKNPYEVRKARIKYEKNLNIFKNLIRDFKIKYKIFPISIDYGERPEEGAIIFRYDGRFGSTDRKVAVNPYLLEELNGELSKLINDIERSLGSIHEDESGELLKPNEAAALLGVSYKTLWRWAKKGRIRYVELPSGRLRYYKNDVQRILKEKCGDSER